MSNQLIQNKTAYEKVRIAMEAKHLGRVALMHDGEIVNIYNDSGDAYSIGVEKYGLGEFSLQKIGDRPIKMGSAGISFRRNQVAKAS